MHVPEVVMLGTDSYGHLQMPASNMTLLQREREREREKERKRERERERDYSVIFIYVRHLCSHTSKPKKGYSSGVPAKDDVVIKGFSWFRFRV